MDYEGTTFRNCKVRLDGNAYTECHFENVVFQYGGGAFVLRGCAIHTYSWSIDGDLARGLEALRAFGRDGGPDALEGIIAGITRILRQSEPIRTIDIG